MERAVTFCGGEAIGLAHLPERIAGEAAAAAAPEAATSGLPAELLEGDMLPSLEEIRRRYVQYVLDRVNGNKRRAAALLGVGRRTLYRWLDDSADDS